MHLQVQHRVPLQFHLLLNHFVHSYPLTITQSSVTQVQPKVHLLIYSQVNLFVHLYTDLEGHLQVQFKVYYQVHPKSHHRAHIIRICCCSVCTLLYITRCTKTFTNVFHFYWPNFASICTFKSIFESIFKCFPYTISFAISVTSGWGGSYLCLSCVVTSSSLTALSSVP